MHATRLTRESSKSDEIAFLEACAAEVAGKKLYYPGKDSIDLVFSHVKSESGTALELVRRLGLPETVRVLTVASGGELWYRGLTSQQARDKLKTYRKCLVQEGFELLGGYVEWNS